MKKNVKPMVFSSKKRCSQLTAKAWCPALSEYYRNSFLGSLFYVQKRMPKFEVDKSICFDMKANVYPQ